ncbi:MAG: response regulator transcription factor [Acidobacteria bacterium]|nr:response regulator transcription factor [Acidobacteriota bacterium]
MQEPTRVFILADSGAGVRKLGAVFDQAGFLLIGSQTIETTSPFETGLADVIVIRSRKAETASILVSRAGLPVLWVGQAADGGAAARGMFGHVPEDASLAQIRAAAAALAVGLQIKPREDRSYAEESEFTMLDPLTDRELEVLNLVAEGFPNREIARRLRVSPNTIKFHVSSIIGKLGASSRTEAVTLGLRHGLIII